MSACDQHRVIHDKYLRENININVTPDSIDEDKVTDHADAMHAPANVRTLKVT